MMKMNCLKAIIILRTIICAMTCLHSTMTASGQTVGQLLKTLPGRDFILRGYGAHSEARIDKADPRGKKRGCDAAVEIQKTRVKKETVEIWLRDIGSPQLNNNADHPCTAPGDDTRLKIPGFNAQDSASELKTILDSFLLTPEAYLASEGIAFSYPEEESVTPEIDLTKNPKGRYGIQPPRELLVVIAEYSEIGRLYKVQGAVTAELDVGTDGRPHHIRITKSPHSSLSEASLRAFSLDRFRPAEKDGRPTNARITVSMSFRLF